MHVLLEDETRAGDHGHTAVLQLGCGNVIHVLNLFSEPQRVKTEVSDARSVETGRSIDEGDGLVCVCVAYIEWSGSGVERRGEKMRRK